ncbi:MAG TPA: hypothetical protein VNZ52_11575, partial [Candidatus Thermoplasmatota archaeon]|nr:hypothetical protein [Candidatus Thermoplasmatota archaeon]
MTEESIHDIIEKSAHLGEEGALRSLLSRPKIKAWVNGDPEREKRLRDEFHRLWLEHHGDLTKPHDGPRAGPGAPPT